MVKQGEIRVYGGIDATPTTPLYRMRVGALTSLAVRVTLTYFADSNLRATYGFGEFSQMPIAVVSLIDLSSTINRQEVRPVEIIALSKDSVSLRLQRNADVTKNFGASDTAIFHMIAIGQGV